MENKDEQLEKLELQDTDTKQRFANSHAWALVKASLVRKVMELDSASVTVEKLTKKRIPLSEIKDVLYNNAIAVNIVVDWLNEIETLGGNMNPNFAGELAGEKEESIIVQLPEEK